MTVLNIYSVDDKEQQNVVACLPEGRHVIGRGGLLHVTDKRVSRKHAVIEVSNEKITLISIHVNPCFFKAYNGRALTVLSQNQENELNDGDQFALLPEDCWFCVKVKREREAAEEPPPVLGKRLHETSLEDNNLTVENKRARLSKDSTEVTLNSDDNRPSTSFATEQLLHINSSDALHNNEHESIVSMEESNSSLHFQETATIEDVVVKQEPPSNNASTALNEGEPSGSNGYNTVCIQDTNNRSTAVNEGEPSGSNTSNNTVSVQGTSREIKEEVHADEKAPPLAGNTDVQNAQDNNAQPAVKTENNDNQAENGAANPPADAPRRVRRERCWYGDRCFRKNPIHRDNFSHPGDEDYESDPDDDRPECPYGLACYRKNLDHRREYKHVARPAPRPRPRPTTPDPPSPPPPTSRNRSPSPTSQNNSPSSSSQSKSPPKKPRRRTAKKAVARADADSDETYSPSSMSQNNSPSRSQSKSPPKKPRRRAAKKAVAQAGADSDDDYDYDDPFINDGSSDDFQPSDDDLDSSESEWVESQEQESESQDRKRMIREAKKFTKNK